MKQKNILTAFILNLAFSIIEFAGGLFTGSIAITSDSIHDFGDAVSIGISYFLERKSLHEPDKKYSYGYIRFSVLGAVITTFILLAGSAIVIYRAIMRFINPEPVHYNGMIVFAVFGVIVNALAAYATHGGESLNQKAVNLHMLEDVLGWIVVLTGSILMKFTDITVIDTIMSIGIAVFIFVAAVKNMIQIADLFLLKMPKDINVDEIIEHVSNIPGVIDAHHIHIWSMDGFMNYGTLHVRAKEYSPELKQAVKEELKEHGIVHSTIEFEIGDEQCVDYICDTKITPPHNHCHHQHTH